MSLCQTTTTTTTKTKEASIKRCGLKDKARCNNITVTQEWTRHLSTQRRGQQDYTGGYRGFLQRMWLVVIAKACDHLWLRVWYLTEGFLAVTYLSGPTKLSYPVVLTYDLISQIYGLFFFEGWGLEGVRWWCCTVFVNYKQWRNPDNETKP